MLQQERGRSPQRPARGHTDVAAEMPPGMLVGEVPPPLVLNAAAELRVQLNRCSRPVSKELWGRKKAPPSELMEAGTAFTGAFGMWNGQQFRPALPLTEKLPETLRLLEAAMSAVIAAHPNRRFLAGVEELRNEGKVNVIARRYSQGQKLGFHKDALGLFTEEIWGCILQTPRVDEVGLEFRRGSPPQRWQLRERPGLVFCLTGPSREAWIHGVDWDRGNQGERLSVTWRWYREDALAWSSISLAERRLWSVAFAAVLQERVETGTLANFLLSHTDPPEASWQVRIFSGANDACGPQLPAQEVRSVVADGCQLHSRLQHAAARSAFTEDEGRLWDVWKQLSACAAVSACSAIKGWERRGADGALEAALTLQRVWADVGEALGFCLARPLGLTAGPEDRQGKERS